MLPELNACEEAEDFFGVLEVRFDPGVLAAHRLAILRRFGELLVEISDRHPGAGEARLRPLVRAALQECYGAARMGLPLGGPQPAAACGGCALAAACGPAEAEPPSPPA